MATVNSFYAKVGCIEVSDNYTSTSKSCIKVSDNYDTCPTVQGHVVSVDTSVKQPKLERGEDFNCTTYVYYVSNLQPNASYGLKYNYGDITVVDQGVFLYKPPRINVPTEDLMLGCYAFVGGNTTDTDWVSPPKLPVTDTPVFGTPSNLYPSAGEYVTIPIANFCNTSDCFYNTPVTSDSGYAVLVGGTITWVIGSDVISGQTYTLSLTAMDDCKSISETATISLTIGKYQFISDVTACDPLCQDGYYFDCETETCVEYSSYYLISDVGIENITLVLVDYTTPGIPNITADRDYVGTPISNFSSAFKAFFPTVRESFDQDLYENDPTKYRHWEITNNIPSFILDKLGRNTHGGVALGTYQCGFSTFTTFNANFGLGNAVWSADEGALDPYFDRTGTNIYAEYVLSCSCTYNYTVYGVK